MYVQMTYKEKTPDVCVANLVNKADSDSESDQDLFPAGSSSMIMCCTWPVLYHCGFVVPGIISRTIKVSEQQGLTQ